MKPKHEILNEIIEENGFAKYLEIGYGSGDNFKQIKCENKTSVDVKGKATFKGTSDDFFKQNEDKFDLIFIDGLHEAEQVRKDLINAMKYLNDDGVIAVHDTIPKNEKMQKVPREQKQWTGDVWRAAVGFHKEYPDVPFETLKADYGLTFIYPQGKKYRKHFEDMETPFAEFDKNKTELLNIVG